MIQTISFGKKNTDVREVQFGTGDIMIHGLMFEDHRELYCLGLSQMPARPIGAETEEFNGLNSDQLPEPVKVILSFSRPESVTTLVHSLIELQKRMFDKDQEVKIID
jgi:hypothetical protein